MFVDALDTNCVTVLLPATFAIVERLSKGDTVGPWDDDKYFVIVSAPIPKTDDESNESSNTSDDGDSVEFMDK